MGTLASRAEIGVWVHATGALLWGPGYYSQKYFDILTSHHNSATNSYLINGTLYIITVDIDKVTITGTEASRSGSLLFL